MFGLFAERTDLYNVPKLSQKAVYYTPKGVPRKSGYLSEANYKERRIYVGPEIT